MYKEPKSQLEDLRCGGSTASTAPECAGLQSEPRGAASSKCEASEEVATVKVGRVRATDRSLQPEGVSGNLLSQQPTAFAHLGHPGKLLSSCPQDTCPPPALPNLQGEAAFLF